MRPVLFSLALCFATPALAEDACYTLPGWDATQCAGQFKAATIVVSRAQEALAELDCTSLKKKKDIQACAARAVELSVTLASAASTLSEAAKGAGGAVAAADPSPTQARVKRSPANRMEAEDNDE